MAQTIKLKRNTENNDTAPVAGDLAVGEIAINSVSGKLYTKKSDENGTVVEISGSGGSGGGGTPELTFTVTVADVSGADKYHLAGATSGFASATAAPTVDLQRGFTYKFDQSDSSNATHPLIITTSSAGGTTASAYTTGVTTTGTVGVDRVLTFVVPHDADDTMYYQCSAHTGLGAELDVGDTIVVGATNLPIYDEDELLASSISKLNFTGTGVTATYEVESVTTPGDADWAKVTALITGGETVTEGSASGSSTLNTGLISFWNLNNTLASVYHDGSGPYTFTNNSRTFSTTQKILGTHSLAPKTASNTNGLYLASGQNSSDWLDDTAFSFSYWVYRVDHVGTESVDIGFRQNTSNGNNNALYAYWHASSGAPRFSIYTDNTTTAIDNDYNWGSNNGTAQWIHIVVTKDGSASSKFKIYHNSTLIPESAYQGSSNTALTVTGSSQGDFMVGAVTGWATVSNKYIDEIGVWDKELTQSEVNELYNSGTGVTPTASGFTSDITAYTFPESSGTTPHTVTVKGGQTALDTTTVPAANGTKPTGITYGGAMKFDGTDDYYTIPSDADFAFGAVDSTDNDFTIESWVYLDSTVAGDCVLFDGRTAAANAVVPLLEVKSNKLTYTVNGVALITDSADLTTNTWHHIAIIRSGANTVVAKNGTTIGGTQTASTYVACPWTIGASSASSATAFFKGWMEEWRVTKGKTRYTATMGSSTITQTASGGTETTVGGYKYHAFLTSGTDELVVSTTITSVETLIVAGGGGGGSGSACCVGTGGGGAGGVIHATGVTLTAGSMSVTVGAGGAGHTNGSNSVFNSVTATGGGHGGGYNVGASTSGGSGGGAGQYPYTSDNGSSGIAGQGHAGANETGNRWGGGGGGAGEVGNTNGDGRGGDGKEFSNFVAFGTTSGNVASSGSDGGYFGGGGGGSTRANWGSSPGELGGTGGGGRGSHSNTWSPVAGIANTGGGGGAGVSYVAPGTGGAGGSGIVIVRYLYEITTTTYSTDYDPSDWTTVFPTSGSVTTTTPTVDVAITGGGSGSALTVKDENTTLATATTQIGFTGSGITATGGNNIITVDVPGGTLPSGGSLGQVLAKNTAASGDAGWIDVTNSATMTNTSTETYFTEVGNGANVTSTSTSPGDTYWSDTVFFARGSETVSTGSSGDPHWQYVTTLITGDETQTGLTFPSAGSVAQTWTRTSGVTQTTGKFGEAYVWDGELDSRIQTTDNSGWALGAPSANTNDFTIEMWMYTVDQTADNPNETFISKGYGSGWMPQQVSNSPITYAWYSDSWGSGGSLGNFTLSNGWNHIAFVREGTTERVYVNGAMKLSGTRSEDFTAGTEVPVIGNTIIGTSNDLSPHGMSDGCKMEQIRITKGLCRYKGTSTTDWDNKLDDGTTVWTEPTVAFEMGAEDPSFTESSGTTPHTVNLIGGANQTTGSGGKFSTEGWNFDGVDDYWTVDSDADFGFGAMSGTDGDFTIETWIYADSTNTSDFVIFDGRTAAANALVPLLERKSNYLKYTVNGVVKITDTAVLPTDAWTHIAVERSGVYTHLFVGGVLKGSFTDSTTYIACPFRVGASSASTAADFFKGKMDDFRISKRARYPVTTTSENSTSDSTDSEWANVKLLITGDETVNGGTLTSSDSIGHTVTLHSVDQVDGRGGAFGKAFRWQGADGVQDDASDGPWIEIPNHADINPGTGAFTCEFWLNLAGTVGYQGPWHKGYVGTGEWTVHSYSGNRTFRHYPGNVGWGTLAAEDTWYHMVIQRDGSGNGTIYVNGAKTGSFTDTSDWTNSETMGFGRGSDGVAYNSFYNLDGQSMMDGIRFTKGVARYSGDVSGAWSNFDEIEAEWSYDSITTTYTHSGDFTPNTTALPISQAVTSSVTTYVPGDIYYSTGKVGIGTSLPAYDLDVVGNVNYTGNLYQNGELIQPATKTWSNVSSSGVTGETDDSVGDGYLNYVKLLLHMNSEGTAYTAVTDHSPVPSTVVFVGDAQLKPLTAAAAASGDANWTDVHLLVSPRTTTLQDESTNTITITNT